MKMNSSHECAYKSESTLYKTGMFAAMNHVTVKALRFYEEQGLLIPAQIQPDTGYRYYTLSQMADVHRITAMRSRAACARAISTESGTGRMSATGFPRYRFP